MKHITRKLTAALVGLCGWLTAGAFTVDGLNYAIAEDSPNSVTVTGATSKDITSVSIPATVTYNGKTYPVGYVKYNAFDNYTSLRSVRFEDSELPICCELQNSQMITFSSPFDNCPIEEYYFGRNQGHIYSDGSVRADNMLLASTAESVSLIYAGCTTALESKAQLFSSISASKITSVAIGGDIKRFGTGVFSECTNLKTVTLLPGTYALVQSIFPSVIENLIIEGTQFTGISLAAKNVIFGEGWRTIPAYFLQSNTSLQTVSLPSTLETIEGSAFSGCSNLTTINYPESLKTIGSSAFYNCKKLTSPEFGSNIKKIEQNAFNNCTSISELTIPGSVTTIGSSAFGTCSNVEKIIFESSDNPIEIATSSFGYITLDSLYLYREIPNAGGCQPRHVVFGEGLRTVPQSFLQNMTTLQTVSLPSTLETIERSAFSGCSNISSIISAAKTPPVCEGSNVFSSAIYPKATLTVPMGSRRRYSTADVWKNFINIQTDGMLEVTVDYDHTMGQVSLNGVTVDRVELDEGEPLDVAISPAVGYAVASLMINDVECADRLVDGTLHYDEIEESLAITVQFEPIMFSVTVPATIVGGHVELNGSTNFAEAVQYGTKVEIRPVADEGYMFRSMTVNGSVVELDTDGLFVIASLESDLTVDAVFEIIRYRATATFDATMGRVTLNGDGGDCMVDYGKSLTIIAEPVAGRYVSGITVNGVAISQEALTEPVVIDRVLEDMAVEVTFGIYTYPVTAVYDNSLGHVSINDSEGYADVEWGADADIMIVPAYGYQIASVYLDGKNVTDKVDTSGRLTVADIKEAHTIDVTFEVKRVRMNIVGLNGGALASIYDFGTELRLIPVADSGWRFHSATVGEYVITELDADGSFTVGPLEDDVNVNVVFENTGASVQTSVVTDNIRVSVHEQTIMIEGAEDNAIAAVYDPSGLCLYRGLDRSIALDKAGVYIVTVSNRSFKVMLR